MSRIRGQELPMYVPLLCCCESALEHNVDVSAHGGVYDVASDSSDAESIATSVSYTESDTSSNISVDISDLSARACHSPLRMDMIQQTSRIAITANVTSLRRKI